MLEGKPLDETLNEAVCVGATHMAQVIKRRGEPHCPADIPSAGRVRSNVQGSIGHYHYLT